MKKDIQKLLHYWAEGPVNQKLALTLYVITLVVLIVISIFADWV